MLNLTSHEWTLVKGVTSENTRGYYGEIGVPSSVYYPGSRRGAVCWINPDEPDLLQLFSGYGYGLSDPRGSSTRYQLSAHDTRKDFLRISGLFR
jgi:hypothetical protein